MACDLVLGYTSDDDGVYLFCRDPSCGAQHETRLGHYPTVSTVNFAAEEHVREAERH